MSLSMSSTEASSFSTPALAWWKKNLYGVRSEGSLACSVFKRLSKFFTVACRTSIATDGPADFPVLWSTNCMRIEPRPSGIRASSATLSAFSVAASFCRLLGGGTTVAIVKVVSVNRYQAGEVAFRAARRISTIVTVAKTCIATAFPEIFIDKE